MKWCLASKYYDKLCSSARKRRPIAIRTIQLDTSSGIPCIGCRPATESSTSFTIEVQPKSCAQILRTSTLIDYGAASYFLDIKYTKNNNIPVVTSVTNLSAVVL